MFSLHMTKHMDDNDLGVYKYSIVEPYTPI